MTHLPEKPTPKKSLYLIVARVFHGLTLGVQIRPAYN